MSALASASEKVSALIDVAGIAPRQPNQMLLSAAPARMVPRLDPVGRCEIDGTGSVSGASGCPPPLPPRPPPRPARPPAPAGGISCEKPPTRTIAIVPTPARLTVFLTGFAS